MKITKFYLNKASYIAQDTNGDRVDLIVDYWNNGFELNGKSEELEIFAKKLLKKKHKVNFAYKVVE